MKFGKVIAIAVGLALVGTAVFATPIGGNSVTVTSLIPGTASTRLGKAEDAAHGSGDTGAMMLGVRSDTLAALGGTTGDYVPPQMNSVGAMYVQTMPHTAGGTSIFRSIDLDETEEEAKATAGQLYMLDVYNNDAAAEMFIKVYDATAASVVVGTTTPVMTVPCAASTHCRIEMSHGIAFANAITFAATTAVADSDTGAPDANDVVVNVLYK